MSNVTEEICGEYLKHIIKCDFVSYNIPTPEIQGELDVIGIKLENSSIYLCEVAGHTQGLLYPGKNKKPDDYNRLMTKFEKGIAYLRKYFPDTKNIILMLWSPIVKHSGPKAKYDTFKEVERLKTDIKKKYNLNLELIVNGRFQESIKELRRFASNHGPELNSGVMRTFQIEEKLSSYLEKHRFTLLQDSQ